MTSHVQHSIQLPMVFGKNSLKVREFYEKLVTHVQSLEMMEKLQEKARLLIDKLPGIRAEFVISDDNWLQLNFQGFVKNLRKKAKRCQMVSRD